MTNEPLLLSPGLEVVLRDGSSGVLYARTWRLPKRAGQPQQPAWYFLPDDACAQGLVVYAQPHEVSEADIAATKGLRPGDWPAADYRLTTHQRQAVYVACMKRQPLPSVDCQCA